MTTSGLITLVLVGLIALRLASRAGQAGPAPTLESVAPKLDIGQVAAIATSSTGSAAGQHSLLSTDERNQKLNIIHQAAATAPIGAANGLDKVVSPGKSSYQVPSAARSQQANAEKLRRGLTNFMNNLNPAPFFVPQLQPQQHGAKTKALSMGSPTPGGSLQAEPATIINEGPSADVLIKGPNRLVQSRPLGGPPRWGRR